MEKVTHVATVPLLPAVNLKETVQFYHDLGFVNLYEGNKRSGGYAVMQNDFMTFHLYTYKKLTIPTPTNMTIIEVNDVDAAYNLLETHYLEKHQKVPPRSGYPKVSKPHTLSYDRRFSITDPNGNIFYVLQSNEEKQPRKKESRFEKAYWESYVLAYSHESPTEAKNMLERMLGRTDLEQESADLVFQAFVLLADTHLLLADKGTAEGYLGQAAEWKTQLKEPHSSLIEETIAQYQELVHQIGSDSH